MPVLLTALLGLIALVAVLMLWALFGGESPPRRTAPALAKPKTDPTPKAETPAGGS